PKYTTYLFGSGALGMGQGGAPVPTETDRDSLAGEDILITRSHFIMHPRGVAFTSASVAGSSPTNAELQNAANWSRVYERGNVRMAAVITNG
ncbi:coat protein, partial [Salmonella enterica]|nr:coat protein [Salmonella enterica]